MKPVIIIAIVAVAMIGVMVPSVFAEIQVAVTPYKESHQIDEPNSVTVKLSKVIPNTNLCYQIIQNNDIIFTNTISNPAHSTKINLHHHYLDAGKYTVQGFYGWCSLEKSFGNDSTQINFDKEPSNLAKFMQENYFPEKIDVGLNYNKQNFSYDANFLYNNLGGLPNIESSVYQLWSGSDGRVIIVISIIEPDVLEIIEQPKRDGNYYSDRFKGKFLPFNCQIDNFPNGGKDYRVYHLERTHLLSCVHNDMAVQVFAPSYGQVDQIHIFMGAVMKKINSIPIPSQSKLSSMYSTTSESITTTTSSQSEPVVTTTSNIECGFGTILKNNVCVIELTCGKGTIEKNGQCVVDKKEGGGCLIATATYGSEMASEVQQLRELRDNTLLQTESGTSFINSFNQIYYSFSPIIADYERENPVFREMVKIAITPMISSLSILNYVDMDSEIEVLGYGISLILLNLGMYLGIPAVVIVGIRKIK